MQRVLIIVVVVILVLAFMVTYVVRFNEAAVVTTFGRAGPESVVTQPGLRLKWPYPFQKVVSYDTRIRFIEASKEQQQTAEKSQLLVTSFVTWRVSDPLKFFQSFGGGNDTNAREHYRKAEDIIKSKLRSASTAVSQFTTGELLSATVGGSKIPDLETQMLDRLKAGDSSLLAYGIEPMKVGVSAIGLPMDTTRAVFEQMKASRAKIANETSTRGTSEAATIRAAAENDAKRIQAFANALAGSIRSKGDTEAAQFLTQMKDDPQLAVFIQNMEFMRKSWSNRLTLVLPTSMPGFEMFRTDATRTFNNGRPPALNFGDLTKQPAAAPAPKQQSDASSSTGANR